MKFVLAQPSIKRFQWELEVVLTNIKSLGDYQVVLLFTNDDPSVVTYIQNKYPFTECHVYAQRDDTRYIPSIKPYLWWQYLKEEPIREIGEYFYIDSDVIFREMPDFKKLGATENRWVGSDCEGYIGYEYLRTRQQGEKIIENFENILRVNSGVVKNTTGAGAQWYIVNPSATYWYKVYRDSTKLWEYMLPLGSDIQHWTAEMWAQLYNMDFFDIKVATHPELDFCRPTDDVKMWDMVKIAHNAGVMYDDGIYFYKGKYTDHTPFEEDLSWVRKDKVSAKYVDAINKVVVK